MTDYDNTWKIMMLGDASAQKTSLTIRYISGFYIEDLKLTIGVDFYSKTTTLYGKKIKLQIWDYGGEERFRFLLHQYCKGANAAFFLYDITNRLTLDHLPDWTQIVREHAGNIPIALVGTKGELEKFRAVSREEALKAAKKYNLAFFTEVSAKTGQNVEYLFEMMIEELFQRYYQDYDSNNYNEITVNNELLNLIDVLMEKFEEWERFSFFHLDKDLGIKFKTFKGRTNISNCKPNTELCKRLNSSYNFESSKKS
ncbi:MAG: GTP-binding protein [Candidatus Lokiarchaeota archaeon]|nr:GTP-binding protein [Candidatus Lokiarchaeota archaeon]